MRTDVDIDYYDLESYQRALLALVNASAYDAVLDRLALLMEEVKSVEQVEKAVRLLRTLYGMDDAWPLLFSYQNLKITYLGLVEWQRTGKCPELQVY